MPFTRLLLLLRHQIFLIFLRLIVFKESGFAKNHMGSIISPLQTRVSWDLMLTERALKLLSLLRVTQNTNLKRLGSEFDGGYFLPSDFINCKGVISGGIGNNNDFELELGTLGKKILQFDPSIETPPHSHPNLVFDKSALGGSGISLIETTHQYEARFGEALIDGILKLDIEGSEWDILAEYSDRKCQDKLCRAFFIVVVELHFLTSIYKDDFWRKVDFALEALLRFYDIVSIYGNNCREIVQIGGVPVVDVVEVTLVRKSSNPEESALLSNIQSPRNIQERSPVYLSWPTFYRLEAE